MENKRAILLLSGGIDSTTLLAQLREEGYEVIALSFRYGQKHHVELEFAKRNAIKYGVRLHKIIELDARPFEKSALINRDKFIATYTSGQLPSGEVNAYVPFRNLVFLSHALSLAESLEVREVFVAFNRDDSANFWDCRPEFVGGINNLAYQGAAIEVVAPFIGYSKAGVVRLARKLGVAIEETISCYQPEGVEACGECLSCLVRRRALEEVGREKTEQ